MQPTTGIRAKRQITLRVLGLSLIVSSLSAVAQEAGTALEPRMVITLKVDFGKDRGQNFGSLFEVRDEGDRAVLGAGFVGVYNTRFRADRHTVQFFVRPPGDENRFTPELLPRPGPDGGVYLFDLDGRVYAVAHEHDRTLRSWNSLTRQWDVSPYFQPGTAGRADALVRVGCGLMQFTGSRVTYDGRPILEPPDKGEYHNFYYAQGRLFFYHTYRAQDGGFTRLWSCPWSPDDGRAADLAQAAVLNLTFVGETPFAYGQLGREVLTCSNLGGLYAFDGREWRTLRAPVKGVSFQIYSMINWRDRLLMAQYPTGELFEYDGQKVTPLTGWPPRIEGVSSRAREAQTTLIYRGDLFVGVWPWGELWRYDGHAERWISMGRMFQLPPVSDKADHPFEKEMHEFNAAHGTKIVFNNWGQRITGMAPVGPDLMLSTSAKGPWRRETRFAFLTDDVWEQYGRVIRLNMPGNLAAPIRWTDGPTQFEFRVERDRMRILQDGDELATAPLDPRLAAGLRTRRMDWGQGVFGPFAGTILESATQRE